MSLGDLYYGSSSNDLFEITWSQPSLNSINNFGNVGYYHNGMHYSSYDGYMQAVVEDKRRQELEERERRYWQEMNSIRDYGHDQDRIKPAAVESKKVLTSNETTTVECKKPEEQKKRDRASVYRRMFMRKKRNGELTANFLTT